MTITIALTLSSKAKHRILHFLYSKFYWATIIILIIAFEIVNFPVSNKKEPLLSWQIF